MKNFVCQTICPIFQYKSQATIGKIFRNFDLVSKILSNEILSNISIQKSGKSRTKLLKFQPCVENFVRGNILSVENFVQYINTNVRKKSDKTVEISAWCQKFCPSKIFSDEILSDKVSPFSDFMIFRNFQ